MVNEKMISNLPSQLLAADQLLTALQALDHAVVCRQRVQGLPFRRGEECVMAVQRQWALPFSVDAQDPQLLAMTGQVGGARGVHMQTIWGGAALCAAVSKVIAFSWREGKKYFFQYIICTKGVNVHSNTWKELFKCICVTLTQRL